MKRQKNNFICAVVTAYFAWSKFQELEHRDTWDAAFHFVMFGLLAFMWFDAGKRFQQEGSHHFAGETRQSPLC
jgi:hypothetical protein